jgi:TonB family protein
MFIRLALVGVLIALLGATTTLQQVYEPGNGVTLPVVVKEVKPQYTARARDMKIQGSVLLRAVVLENGRVDDAIEILRSLDRELDEQAIVALKQWEFKPGTRNGQAVPVRISVELTFRLAR